MSAPVFIESPDEVGEPGPQHVYQDRMGDYWWYGTDNEDCEGWVWGSERQIGGQAPQCGFARRWEFQGGLDLPWRHVGTVVDGKFTPNVVRAQASSVQGFTVKDSGVREEYANGFVRDTEEGKYDYARVLRIEGLHLIPVEALERWAAHMVLGAEKYGEDNWRQARGPIAVSRFIRSLCRHVVQFVRGDVDEDHGAAIMFNVAAAMITPKED
jgi:hypothetical protein